MTEKTKMTPKVFLAYARTKIAGISEYTMELGLPEDDHDPSYGLVEEDEASADTQDYNKRHNLTIYRWYESGIGKMDCTPVVLDLSLVASLMDVEIIEDSENTEGKEYAVELDVTKNYTTHVVAKNAKHAKEIVKTLGEAELHLSYNMDVPNTWKDIVSVKEIEPN